MAEQTNKKKLATSAVALATAAALLLGGTLAWQSISQEATNIVAAEVNPGGRLHDDFDGSSDKNIYVENFGTQNIYARVKLSEYLEIGPDAGNLAIDGTSKREENLTSGAIEVLLGDPSGAIDDKANYTTYLYGEDNISDNYWTKDWEGKTLYIPTFNKNQDSLEADLNGTYEYVDDAGESDPYGDFVDINEKYNVGDPVTGNEIVDADTNDDDEGEYAVEGTNIDTTADVNHAVAKSIDGTVISMTDYNNLSDDEKSALQAWVYDSDGWAYWSQAIAPETSTGLLLDGITDLGLIDEDYYYAIHVTGQFITAGDLGNTNGTGFYADADEEPSEDALALLKAIGVKTSDDDEESEDPYGFSHMLIGFDGNNETMKTFTDNGYAAPGTTLNFNVVAYLNNGEYAEITTENTKWTIDAIEGKLDSGTTVNSGEVTISENQEDLSVLEFTVTYTDKNGTTYDKTEQILVSNEAVTLDVTVNEEGPYYTDTGYSVTATAINKSGQTVPMKWRYDIGATNSEEDLYADIVDNSFTADDPGEYTITAWAEYMWGKKATTDVTVIANTYAFSYTELPVIASNDTETGVQLTFLNDGADITKDATYTVSGGNATVTAEGKLVANETVDMDAPLEQYEVTAYVDETPVSTMYMYMYNAEQHTLRGHYLIDGNDYFLFNHTVSTLVEIPTTEVCVWRYPYGVEEIYTYVIEGNYTEEGLAQEVHSYLNGDSTSVTGGNQCGHLSAE